MLVGSSALILCAAGTEVIARVAVDRVMVTDHHLADDELGFRSQPLAQDCWDARGKFRFVTNSLGFRGPELPDGPPPAGTERVLMLGDSFVHGMNVREEDWMGTAVKTALAEAGRTAEVYSLCTMDWGTAQELLALRRYGERVGPDTVVLVLFPTNDLFNNELRFAGKSVISPGDYFRPYLVPDCAGGFEREYALPWHALLRHSVLFRLLEKRANDGRTPADMRFRLAGDPYSFDERVRDGAIPERHFEHYLPPEPGSDWESAWRTTEALILATRDEAARLGAEFLVAEIPQLVQVVQSGSALSTDVLLVAKGHATLASRVDFDLPERMLEEFFHREGIAHVQMLDVFRRMATDTLSPAYVNDGHIGGAAHTALGRAVGARMASGAPDLCLRGGEPPSDVLATLGEPPFELDFEREEHWPVLGSGWHRWNPLGAPHREPGWPLDGGGQFCVRRGFYVLRGVATKACRYPLTLAIGDVVLERRSTYAKAILEAPGEFTIELDTRALPYMPGADWTVLRLNASTGGPGGLARGGVVLKRMSVVPEPPPGWEGGPPPRAAAKPGIRAGMRLAMLLVRLAPHLIRSTSANAGAR